MTNARIRRGRKAHKFNLNQVKDFIDECGGNLTLVAKRLGVCAVTLYRYIDVEHPELKEYIDEARRHDAESQVDMSEHVSKTLLDRMDEDADKALRSAQYILKRRKAAAARGWITDDKSDEKIDDVQSGINDLKNFLQNTEDKK